MFINLGERNFAHDGFLDYFRRPYVTMKKEMTETKEVQTSFPSEVGRVSSHAVRCLDESEFFTEQFSMPVQARELFLYRFSESLLPKFISGEEIGWDDNGFERVFCSACVEHALYELELEGKVHVFEDAIVMAEGGL